MSLRTGIAAATFAIKALCHVLITWRNKIDGVIAAAVDSNVITSAQALELKAFLDAADGACAIIRLVSGY